MIYGLLSFLLYRLFVLPYLVGKKRGEIGLYSFISWILCKKILMYLNYFKEHEAVPNMLKC